MKKMYLRFLAGGLAAAFAFSAFGEAEWTTDFKNALETAKAQDKAVLLDFTGSDWCGWCMKMKKEALDTPLFQQFADKNLVLVEVDFPHGKPQSDAVKAQNQQLANRFQVDGYPCFVVLSKTGRVLGRQDGYLEGGADTFVAKLRHFYHGSHGSTASGGNTGQSDFDSFFKKPGSSPAP